MKRILVCTGFTVAFALAYTQIPFPTAHYYFTWGMAKAGFGLLQHDWLAQSTDPFPIFSTIVLLTERIHRSLFVVYPFLLLSMYIWSLIDIVRHIFPKLQSSRLWLVCAALVLLHSALLSELTGGWSGVLSRGVANYYLVGPVFQPSMIGVVLVFALSLLVRQHYRWAVVIAALGSAVHPSYLLASGCIVLSAILSQRTHPREALLLGMIGTCIALPIALYTQFVLFASTSAQIMAQAQSILVHVRIPHHAEPERWIATALLRIPYVFCAIWLVRRTRIALPLAVLLCCAIALSALQMLTHSDALALIAPWRISAVLVPVSTAIVVAWALKNASLPYAQHLSVGVIFLCALFGAYTMHTQQAFPQEFKELRSFILHTAKADHTYLVPPRERTMQHARLSLGVPIYVNFKLHPFQDAAILEWHERMQKAQRYYEAEGEEACQLLNELPVTHIITTSDHTACTTLKTLFHNTRYTVYAL